MISIPDLWMPIVLSAIFVFVVSSILHMALKYHRADYKAIPDEESALAELRKAKLPRGYYNFPHFDSMKEMGTAAGLEKLRRGPVGMMTLLPNGPISMGKLLGLWFVYTLVISLFVGYLAGRTLASGADYLTVFRFAGTAAFLAYGIGQLVDSIWKGMPWSNTFRAVADGLVYSLVTAGTFGWLWPR